MVRTSRRRLIAVGGMAALTGCLGNTSSSDDETPEPSRTTSTEPEDSTDPDNGIDAETVSDDLRAALAAIPESISGTKNNVLHATRPVDAETPRTGTPTAQNVANALGLETGAVDCIVRGTYSDEQTGVVSVVGSFDADEPSLREVESRPPQYREDGLLVLPESPGRPKASAQTSIDAAKAAVNGERDSVTAVEGLERLLASIGSMETVIAFPTFPPSGGQWSLDEEYDGVDLMALGSDRIAERTFEMAYVGLFDSESNVDQTLIKQFAEDSYYSGIGDLSFEQDGRLLVGRAHREIPPRESDEASPDVRFRVTYDQDEGTATVQHRGGDTVDPSTLTLYVGEESVEADWGVDSISAGDGVSVEAEPFTAVRIEWTDPEDEDVFDTLERQVVATRDTFESAYDPETDTVTFTYTGERSAPTDNIQIRHDTRPRTADDGAESEEPLSDRQDRLEPGDEITVEGVSYNEQVGLTVHYEWDNGAMSSSLVYHSTRPPGYFHLETDDGDRRLVFAGDTDRPAADYRVTVGDTPAGTQFDDEYTTLSEGDGIAVAGDPGEAVVVSYLDEGEPAEVFSQRLEPPVSFECRRDGEQFVLEYTADTEWDAAEFDVRVVSKKSRDLTFDTETLTAGDTLRFDPPMQWVQIEWTGNGDPIDVFSTHIRRLARFELEGGTASPTLRFVGTGRWPTEEFQVTVDGEAIDNPFGSGTVTNGDRAEIDAARGSEVAVSWTESERAPELLSETVHAEFEFEFEPTDDEMRIVSATDGSLDPTNLTVLVDGDERTERPDAWAEQYDTVEAGDAITVETPSSYREVTVVHNEWHTTDEFDAEGN